MANTKQAEILTFIESQCGCVLEPDILTSLDFQTSPFRVNYEDSLKQSPGDAGQLASR